MDVGTRIREHREAAGLRQDQLAERCHVSRQTISNWERGKTLPDIESLKVIALEFGTTVDALIGDDLPRIARRADEEARRLLALLVAYVTWLILTLALSTARAADPETFSTDLWRQLDAALFGAGVVIVVLFVRAARKNSLRYYSDLGRHLSKSLILPESRVTRVARVLLGHIQPFLLALVAVGVLAGLAAGGHLSLVSAVAVVIVAGVYGLVAFLGE